ncbi:MAG: SDR family oxidoreductase [Desulfobacterales bacterium]
MRILVLGGDGMLGHQLFSHLRNRHDVKVTLRQNMDFYNDFDIFSAENSYSGVDVRSGDKLIEVILEFQPDVIVNAIGIIKQRKSAKESITSIEINSLFPHRLAHTCKTGNAKLIHLSTDCVFSGKKGNYREEDTADAEDLYGRTKLLGEVIEEHCLTLRTSMIGPELHRNKSLLEWFLAQRGTAKGFKRAIFSGFTTFELSRIIERLIVEYPSSHGLYHVSADPISKYDLLSMIKQKMNLSVHIEPDTDFTCDRSLDSSRFKKDFQYSPPSWADMVDELCERIK